MTSQNAVHDDPGAVVTGGNRGIGLEPCRQLADRGYLVRDADKASREASLADMGASVLWGVILPDDGPTGGFFQDGAHLPW